MERINLKIDKEKKKEIVQYVEETEEYPSVSHFLRLAASREMADEDDQVQQVSPRVVRTLDKIVTEVEEMQDEINSIAVQLEGDSRAIEELAQKLYDTIPKAPVASSAEVAATTASGEQLDRQHAHLVLDETDAPTTIPELARRLDADKEDIKEAVRHLKANFLPVLEIVDDEGNKHFLKQEERR
jgi:translation initiation factor 2 alpha subunit (eIF-2alpha)